ncbi:CotH kinase family protein [Flavobacteriales bacterium]|nr:CotH kinase family protein [Flavobacteriales bacterium]
MSFLVVFCSGKDRTTGPYLHTNFKLKSSGESVLLTASGGQMIDVVKATPLGEDFSLARVVDGIGDWERFSNPTPLATNQLLGGISFSHQPGYYQSDFLLELESVVGHEIRYTLDGSIPDANSALYASAIPITDLAASASPLSAISTSLIWDPPTGTFPKLNVVRARSFQNGQPTSQIFSKTYMIDDEVGDYLLDYPIVSIITDSLNLFDYDTGIYVPGANFVSGNSTWTGNFFQKGVEWERESHVEFFEDENLTWSQNFGLRIHGGKSRNAPQKSLRMYARDELGAAKFNHQLFETKDKTVYDKFIMRSHFGCWNKTMIKDALTGYIARNLDFDSQHAKPAIVFINGEYWGIHTIRDYYDSNYIEEEYDVDKEDVNILLHGAGTIPNFPPDYGAVEGSLDDYAALMDFIENNPLSNAGNYQYVTTEIDVSSMIDYFCTAIYFNHRDWPTNNHKVWRGEEDSKWRWLLYDFDSGWGYSSVANNSILYAAHPTGSTIYNPPYAAFLFRSMLESPQFEADLIQRYACLMNNEFSEDTVANAIDYFEEMYDPNAEQHIRRWHNPTTYSSWQSNINSKLRNFNNLRRSYAIGHVSDWFDIDFDPDDYDCNSVVTDVAEVEGSKDVRLYPNPASDFVWIDWDEASENATVSVIDITGKQVLSEPYAFHQKIDTWNLNSGIYMVVLQDQKSRVTKKFIVQ